MATHDVTVLVRVQSQALEDTPPLSTKACVVAWAVVSEVAVLTLAVTLFAVGAAARVLAEPLMAAGRALYGASRLGSGS